MGHSLGEYMALTAAGASLWSQGLRLVAVRAVSCRRPCPLERGHGQRCSKCPFRRSSGWYPLPARCGVANINCDGQGWISPVKPPRLTRLELLKENGAKRVMPLNVAVASHCPLMEPAARGLEEHLGA